MLKDTAVPARSILAPSYPATSRRSPTKPSSTPSAKAALAKAGYPDGKGFPPIEIWYREQGGYNAAIAAPMLQYLQGPVQAILGIDMGIKSMPTKDWTQALKDRTNGLFLAPYEYDYLDPSNFYDLFKTGGRHHISYPDYDKLVDAGDAGADWDQRLDDYAKAEQVLIDNAALVPLVHPVTIAAVSDKLQGDGVKPNSKASPRSIVSPGISTPTSPSSKFRRALPRGARFPQRGGSGCGWSRSTTCMSVSAA